MRAKINIFFGKAKYKQVFSHDFSHALSFFSKKSPEKSRKSPLSPDNARMTKSNLLSLHSESDGRCKDAEIDRTPHKT